MAFQGRIRNERLEERGERKRRDVAGDPFHPHALTLAHLPDSSRAQERFISAKRLVSQFGAGPVSNLRAQTRERARVRERNAGATHMLAALA
ncbi:hypothetical protein RRG08_036052 [Elysia crispata]|uniref:Uncharacterized protein n=1 Tax=Elysia crispata TaxID=231223 RepID=A0AAE1AKZ6_9GAST|nr:hypothetical protein RRG08_036052 [Elysia crispata]